MWKLLELLKEKLLELSLMEAPRILIDGKI
jgi:hypothetical protein